MSFPAAASTRSTPAPARLPPPPAVPRKANCNCRRPLPRSARASKNSACCWRAMPMAAWPMRRTSPPWPAPSPSSPSGRPAARGRGAAKKIAAMARHQPFVAQCQARGLRLAADSVYLLAHWTADRDLPRRFEVPFLVARMPEGQTPVADEAEQFEPLWVRPADALARHEAGQFFMIFPTIRTLQRLSRFADTQAVLDAVAQEKPLWVSCPRAGILAGKQARYMEDDPPFGELALVCPDGQIVHPLDWQSERVVPLLKNLQRLTAPNPGVMTGPGTNSYLLGEPATGFIAIDPGPADAEHLDRLWRAAGGDIR